MTAPAPTYVVLCLPEEQWSVYGNNVVARSGPTAIRCVVYERDEPTGTYVAIPDPPDEALCHVAAPGDG